MKIYTKVFYVYGYTSPTNSLLNENYYNS